MSDKVQYGKGAELAVSTTPATEYIQPDDTNGGGNSDFANEIEFWNTGSTDVRIQFNLVEADFTVTEGGIIPAGEKSTRFNFGNPIKRFVYATESGTSTLKYFASR